MSLVKMSLNKCENLGDVYKLFHINSERDIIMLLQAERLLKPLGRCGKCRSQRNLRKNTKYKGGYAANCKKCKKFRSLTDGTFFESTNIPFKNIFALLWTWASHISLKDTTKITGVHIDSVKQYYRYFRDIASWKLLSMEPPQFGGTDVVVQIEESVITKRQYNRGRHIREKWVLGIYDSTIKKGIVLYVTKRDKQTLVPLIQQYVAEGSVIWTDGWSAYQTLNQYGFQHHVVNHSKQFKSKDRTFTNGLEAYWIRLKKFCRHTNVLHSSLLPEHIDEFMYRENYNGSTQNVFNYILLHLKEKYVV